MPMIEGKVIAMLAIGFTHYVDVGKSEDAAIFYKTESEVHMRLPGAPATMSGSWDILPDGYFVKWQDGPEGKWGITSEPGVLTYISPDGKPAGKITRIVSGNPENLH